MRTKTLGFTVIELLVAIAIAGLLMVAVMQVLGTLGRISRLVEQQLGDGETWAKVFANQLERDVSHARDMAYEQGVLRIETLGIYDADSLEWRYFPANIIYYMISYNGVNVLVREQNLMLEGHSSQAFKQVAAIGVKQWGVKQVEEDEDDSLTHMVFEMQMLGEDDYIEVPLKLLKLPRESK